MDSRVGIIIKREFMERAGKKSFIFTTLLMPLLMLALMAAPSLIMLFSKGDSRQVEVIDESGFIFDKLKSNEDIAFVRAEAPLDSLVKNEDTDAVLVIPAGVANGSDGLLLYSRKASSLSLESGITSQVNDIIENERIASYNIAGLDKILEEIHSDVSLKAYRTESTSEEAKESSAGLSYGLGLVLMLILYMVMLIYGQMVMTSIIEEKNNRVLELVVSSVKPVQLMLGKICGIGLVAVTQIVIWAVLIGLMTAFLLPAIMPAELLEQVQTYNAAGAVAASDTGIDPEMIQIVARLSDVGYILSLFCYMALYLIGGFMLYAAIYAAIGSAVDNIQDASQLQSIPMFLIIFGMMFSMMAAQDPSSGIAVALSYVPFTSPMVMMSRIPSGVAAWEIVVSLAVLYLSFLVMVWIAAKIYRVGIFMYGKKPSWSELIHWARQK